MLYICKRWHNTSDYLFVAEKSPDVVVGSDAVDGNSTIDASVEGYPDGHRPTMDTASIFGLVIWFFCVLYSSIRSSSITQTARYFQPIGDL